MRLQDKTRNKTWKTEKYQKLKEFLGFGGPTWGREERNVAKTYGIDRNFEFLKVFRRPENIYPAECAEPVRESLGIPIG